MARILLTTAIFFMTFSHHLMAADVQVKKSIPLTEIDTPACIAAHDNCRKMKDSKDLNACVTACQKAEAECTPTAAQAKAIAKTDKIHDTRHRLARSYRQTCAKAIKDQKKQK